MGAENPADCVDAGIHGWRCKMKTGQKGLPAVGPLFGLAEPEGMPAATPAIAWAGVPMQIGGLNV